MSVELLSSMLSVLTLEGDQPWVGEFLLTLSKADNFEMTLMFTEDKEKKLIKEIVSKLPKEFSGKVSQIY